MVTNIASGDTTHTSAVVDAGAIPILQSLLSSLKEGGELLIQVVWALGNIAGDGPRHRDAVLAGHVVDPLLSIMRKRLALREQAGPSDLSCLRNATWTISNLFRGVPHPPREALGDALPVLAELLGPHDDEVLTDASWALSYASDG